MRDALRYKRKKIKGKSGDSGDEMHVDETSKDGADSNDYLSFLTPTTSKFSRKTMVMGAATPPSTLTESNLQVFNEPTDDEIAHEQATDLFTANDDSSASVYSFVSTFLNCLFKI